MPPRPSPHSLDARTIAHTLCEWFDAHGRDLPWRRRRTGYRNLVCEFMLQQTQVSRVIEPYGRFLRTFPTVKALARADEQAVLTAWQGLGYYRRAKMLHRAAKVIVDHHRGRVPRQVDALRQLPGVGAYTAGAIASIVYHHRVPAVDGNVFRVLSRLHDRPGAGRNGEDMRWAWSVAGQLVQTTDRPGALNEALMEFGATICIPRTPKCEACPVTGNCAAYHSGRASEIPHPAGKGTAQQRMLVHHHAVIVLRGERILLEQRPTTGLWASMWQVPTIESSKQIKPCEITKRLPVNITRLQSVGDFEHNTTHRQIQFHIYTARSRAQRGVWRCTDDLADLPMSNAMRKVLDAINTGSGHE